MRFKKPFAPFLNYAASRGLPVQPHEIFDQDGSLTKRLAGSGPFQLDVANSQRGTRWVFKKNLDYWGAGQPYLDEVHCLVLPDDATVNAAFQSKQLDIIPVADGGDITPQAAVQIKAAAPGAQMQGYV